MSAAPTLWTAGHGDREADELVSLLQTWGILRLVDVRAYPSSRRHPQFESAALERVLAERGIRYVWEGRDLGGFRKPLPGSPHTALRSDGFRGFADHMGSAAFSAAMERLLELAGAAPTAILCAEREPLHCHRSMISDFLVTRGLGVRHLIDPGKVREHLLSPLARVEGRSVIYDRGGQGRLEL